MCKLGYQCKLHLCGLLAFANDGVPVLIRLPWTITTLSPETMPDHAYRDDAKPDLRVTLVSHSCEHRTHQRAGGLMWKLCVYTYVAGLQYCTGNKCKRHKPRNHGIMRLDAMTHVL